MSVINRFKNQLAPPAVVGDTIVVTVDVAQSQITNIEHVDPAPEDPDAMFDEKTKKWLVPGDTGYAELVTASVPGGIDDSTIMSPEKVEAVDKLVKDARIQNTRAPETAHTTPAEQAEQSPFIAHRKQHLDEVRAQLPKPSETAHTTAPLLSVKDIETQLAGKDVDVRGLLHMFNIPSRGEGPKPKNGKAAKLYNLNDVTNALALITTFKPEP